MLRSLLGLLVMAVLAYGLYASTRGEAKPIGPASSSSPASSAMPRGALPFAVTFTEADLQSAASGYFPQAMAGATLSDPVVRLRPGELVLDLAAHVSILRTTASVTATPFVANGRPAARITSATIAGQPVPEGMRATLADQLARAIDAQVPAAVVVSAVEVSAGKVTITGTLAQ